MSVPMKPYGGRGRPPRVMNSSEDKQDPQLNPIAKSIRTDEILGYPLPVRDVDGLPLEKIEAIVKLLSKRYALPRDMCLLAVITAASICCQGVANLEIEEDWKTVLSLYGFVLAKSGAGKDPLEKATFGAISEEEDGLLDMLLSNILDNEGLQRPLIINNDITVRGLIDNLQQTSYGALISTESSKDFAKWNSGEISALNQLFDGQPLRVTRSGPNGYTLKLDQARLSTFWAQQPELFDDFIETKAGKYWLKGGAINRFLFCRPKIDFSAPLPDPATLSMAPLEVFRDRQRELLYQAYGSGRKLDSIRFSPEAKALYKEMAAGIRENSAPGGYFEHTTGHASKIREIIARLAGIFHLFEGLEGDVSVSTLMCAYEVAMHYADYHVAQFTPIPQSVLDANEIDSIIADRYRATSSAFITPDMRFVYFEKLKEILPSHLRKSDRLHDAVRELIKRGRYNVYWLRAATSRSRKRYLDLHPQMAVDLPHGMMYLGEAF